MEEERNCGVFGFYPKWLRSKATPKTFIIVYGLLGTVQAMAFIYIIVTLTTIEKRFKIPSQTTGIILSGNEISQILSLILTYYGGAGHRPRWIAIGVALSAASCLVLALPHAIYGPGKDALALTKEYLNHTLVNSTAGSEKTVHMCPRVDNRDTCDAETLSDISIVPRLLVFISQFILGIGTSLYYGLGQTYLDDNTQKKNTPMLLGITFALRTVGPVFGFVLGYACLSLYIDPSLHPVITKQDPRWLGAWWLGWIIMGGVMLTFSILIAMFPKEMSKPKKEVPKDGEIPLKRDLNPDPKLALEQRPVKTEAQSTHDVPTIREFPIAVKRIFANKLLTCNNFAGIFYVLGASAYITFLSKYVEVLFGTSAAGGTIIAGPVTLIGMVLGFILSGVVISKFKPGPRPLLSWNVIVGGVSVLGQIAFMFLGCSDASFQGLDMATMRLNLTTDCNLNCGCEGIKYSPVCHEPSSTTFYSACHAGCRSIVDDKSYGNCSCVPTNASFELLTQLQDGDARFETGGAYFVENALDGTLDQSWAVNRTVRAGPCTKDCKLHYMLFTILSCVIQLLACSGKIGNVLINYRGVEVKDKSLAQGITLMMISLLALIPGPIIFGAIIDSTCLIWDDSCGQKGNCWFYHKEKFRFRINTVAAAFTLMGIIFDAGVCYLGKDLDLYGDMDEDKRRDFTKDVFPITLNDAKKPEVNGIVNIQPKLDQKPS